ncbi:MAG: multicopper oxidase domain-containing protein, partial [Candidatus Eremiobacteraeota bacterium]|nr:multicopper oxidase domain-containing protein [Candidatus Eremiobacteraeota bacterium]
MTIRKAAAAWAFVLVSTIAIIGGATPSRAQSSGPIDATRFAAMQQRAETDALRDFKALPSLPRLSAGTTKTFYLFAEVSGWEIAPGTTVKAWTYNGTVPGPTIHVRQGDRVRVVLINKLPEATTIHWHGLPVGPDMDGVPGFSQNAVAPDRAFVYSFVASEPGTYIYHTHFDDLNQIDRGLYGAVVVDDAKPTQRFDREYLMLLSSWRVRSDAENFFSINGKSYPLTRPFVVHRGDRVRVREINISGSEFHTMHLHGHRFETIAIDGQAVAAANRQRMVTLTIGPGETRDIAFTADAQPGTWMFHCHVADHMMNGAMGPGGLVTAVQYDSAPDKLASLARQDLMAMNGGSGAGSSGSSGAPLSAAGVYILGAIAGLTIFFGLPFAAMRRVPSGGIAFLNAIAIGVLFFLLFDILRQAGSPLEDALHQVQTGAPRSGFLALILTYVVGLGVGLLGLVLFARSFIARRGGGALPPLALATMIAAGIGLHNFSEGLAIGQSAATGAMQLALLLIIGFG